MTQNEKKDANVNKPDKTAVEMLSELMEKDVNADYDLIKAKALGEKYEIDL